ncbi:uncharacterized protein EI90DRAFT_3041252 [Cantharellus anzutake]|uniref:uncharacterized protein n=1 Tax=Cantharellus anzutake TaxID=1750568 RepID=UPI0019080A7A|nr:uncharacterized protein EI90DRAFT_3041252 [Cantharellus anzutake]KAF8337993.1 hypothetical protein EI90DRAFT_3041252 [Cantharellus anzutake]
MLRSNTTSCHINYLPAEILREIFVLGLSDGPSSSERERMHAVSFVCRHWRLLALEEARLWSEISIYLNLSDVWCGGYDPPILRAKLKRAALRLCRSKGAPLTLSISLHRLPIEVHDHVNHLVSPHYHRCHRLSIDLYHDQHDAVDRAKVWLPLPDSTFDRLEELRIAVGQRAEGKLNLGPPLTLRRLDISTSMTISLHPGFRITDEVKLSGLDPKTVFKVLKHCCDVKKIKISSCPGLDPLLSSLSFPTLEELTLQACAEIWYSFPIQNAPNLRYLDCPSLYHLSRLEALDAGTRSGIIRALNGLEVLVIRGLSFDACDSAFIRFENLRMMRVDWVDDDFIHLLSLAPEFPPSHNGEPPTGPAVHFSFPALQLLIVRGHQYHKWCQLLLEVVRARPMLNLVFGSGFCPPEFDLVRGRVHFVENIWWINDNELFARFLG